MARYGIIIAAMLTLVGDNGGGDQIAAPPQPPSRPAQISMNAADWTLKHSPRLDRIEADWVRRHGDSWSKTHLWRWNLYRPSSQNTRLSHPLPDPQGGWSLSLDALFPRSKLSSYLVTTASPILTQGQYVKMVGEISARGEVVEPLATRHVWAPAWCRMYFREVDDDPTYSKTGHLNYRWWSTDAVRQGGRFVLVVGLEPQFWMNVLEQRGDGSAATAAGFQQAVANPQTIGIMCSGTFVAGQDYLHALVDPTFSMFSFAVCDRRPTRVDLADAPSARQEDEACAPTLQ